MAADNAIIIGLIAANFTPKHRKKTPNDIVMTKLSSAKFIIDYFKPKGKKNLELYNNNIPDVVKEIEKWVTKKTKLPASQSQWSDPKNTVRIIVNANSILKKLK